MVVRRIVRGGMGVVYCCSDLQSEQEGEEPELVLAFKSYPEAQAWNAEVRARFEREAALWIMLPRHPNIALALAVQRAGTQYLLARADSRRRTVASAGVAFRLPCL